MLCFWLKYTTNTPKMEELPTIFVGINGSVHRLMGVFVKFCIKKRAYFWMRHHGFSLVFGFGVSYNVNELLTQSNAA